jgi:hypothetical protein
VLHEFQIPITTKSEFRSDQITFPLSLTPQLRSITDAHDTAAAKPAQTSAAGAQKGKALKPALSSHPMQTRSATKVQPTPGAPAGGVKPPKPSASVERESLSGSQENPITLTAAKHSPASKSAKVLSPTPVLRSWQNCKKGVPLSQAIQYCKSKGIPVSLRLESSKGPSALHV